MRSTATDVAWSACMSVCDCVSDIYNRELYTNCGTDRGAVSGMNSGRPKEPCITVSGSPGTPGKGKILEKTSRPIVKYKEYPAFAKVIQ